MASESETIMVAPPAYIAKLHLPTTTHLEYERVFKHTDEETQIQLKKISDFRNEVVVASERAFGDAAVRGVNKYLPSLFGLMDATEKLPPDFMRSLDISWTSFLGTKDGRKYSHSSWMYEVVFVLEMYGFLHRKMASERMSLMNAEDFNQKYTEIVKLLSQAAGVFQFISESCMSKFFVNPKDLPLPETLSETFLLLANLSLAESQELVIKRSILSQNKATVVAKLCAGASTQYDTCLKMAKAIKEQTTHPRLPLLEAWWEEYLQWKKLLFEAEAAKFMAIHHQDAGAPGIAIAYMQYSMRSIAHTINSGKHSNENITNLWTLVTEERNSMTRLWHTLNHDNDTVYHETIKPEEVKPIEPRVLAKPQPFDPPSAAEIKVVRKESSFLCVIS